MKNYMIMLIGIFFIQCTSNNEEKFKDAISIKFEKVEKENTSLLKDLSFVKLETTKESLLEEINQVEVFNEKIYILNNYGLYIFGLDGKYIKKLQGSGNGPGEFLSSFSFWIDKDGYILILDRQLSRLLKYDAEDLTFVEDIVMPYNSPIGFAKIPDNELFIYYYPLRPPVIEAKQLFIADNTGHVKMALLDGAASGKILHGNNSNFYLRNEEMRFYPYFSNKIYAVSTDILNCRYTVSFRQNEFPEQEVFTKYDNSGDIMKEIIFGDKKWIRTMSVYETDHYIALSYYIEKHLYFAAWSRSSGKTVNFKSDQIIDDLGIGGVFPLPKGVYQNQIIGEINPFKLDRKQIKNDQLKVLTEGISEEENPILAFYSFDF